MTGRALYVGEELSAWFTARGEVSDYGVPGSPTWVEWVDVEIERLQVLGFDVDVTTLSNGLIEAIRELADEVEFEEDEPHDHPGTAGDALRKEREKQMGDPQKKYRLTAETKMWAGQKLHRIEALTSFGSVVAGDLGGWIEKEDNLSQSYDAWVCGDALVCGNALVCGDALVYGNALVYDDAQVCGNARVYGNARVTDNARVYGEARVYGDAWVYGNARVRGNALVCGDARVCGDTLATPIIITGLAYPITIADTHMQIGCECHSIDEWRSFDDRRISKMDGKEALKFWKSHREHLLAICAAAGRPLSVESEAGGAA